MAYDLLSISRRPMRHVSILTVCCLLLLKTTTLYASLLYTVPVEVPSREEKILWPQNIEGPGEEMFSEALDNYRQGDYKTALAQFNALIDQRQDSKAAAVATLYAGSIYFKMAMEGGKKGSTLLLKALESYQANVRNYPDPENVQVVILEIGKIYREMGLMEEAKGSFKRVIREHPSTPFAAEAQYQIALTCEREGAYREAVNEYKTLSIRYAGVMERERIFGAGRALFALHEFGEAKRYYEEGLRRWPAYVKGYPEVMLNYSESQFQNGEFSKAREGFLTLYNLYPKDRDAGFALMRIGDTYVLERKRKIAESIYKNVLDLFPDSEEAIVSKLSLGDIKFLSQSGDMFYQDALKYYSGVERSSVKEIHIQGARYRIGKVLEAQGEHRKALSIYDELIGQTDGPLNMEISQSFQNLSERIGKDIQGKLGSDDYFGVVKTYQTFYKNFIDRIADEELLIKIAEVHTRLILYNEAFHIYQKIIDRNGAKRELALFKAGDLYFHTGDYKMTVETLGRHIADYPESERGVRARVLMGEGLYHMKEFEKAANYFYAVLRDAPYQFPSAYIKLSNILLRSGGYEESVSLLRDMINHFSGGEEKDALFMAYTALGNALYGLERYQEALDSYLTALGSRDLDDESETVQFMVGNCLFKLDKRTEAQKIFSKLSEKSTGVIKRFSDERLKDIEVNL